MYHVNTSEYDLTRYQLYKTLEECKTNPDHSLVYALKVMEIYNTSVDCLINGGDFYDPSYQFPQRLLHLLSHKLQVNIYFNCLSAKEVVYSRTIPKTRIYDKTIYLCHYKGHYFIRDILTTGKRSMSSLTLIRHIDDDKEILRQSISLETRIPIKVNLQDIVREQSPFSFKPTVKKPNYYISFADTETLVDPVIPMMYGAYIDGAYKSIICGEDSSWLGFKRFLNLFPNGYNIVYYHNLKFDWLVIRKNPWINIKSVVKKDSIYYSVIFTFYRKTFELRDSYKFIPKPLKDFGKTFNLGVSKHQFIIYRLYTIENTKKLFVKYRDCIDEDKPLTVMDVLPDGLTRRLEAYDYRNYIMIDERIAVERSFISQCDPYLEDGKYYHMMHCEMYLKLDCEVLMEGMKVYRDRMLKILDYDCYDKITLPSIVHQHLCEIGCYEGVYQLTDNLRTFVGKSVHGGRVCSRFNKMWDVEKRCLVLDGRSLYPSAIAEICDEFGGFPTGPCKEILDWSKKDEFRYYVVRIRITKIGKRQQIPFISYYHNNGRHYTNDVSEHTESLVVDMITLSDWVLYQLIEYEFIEGVYWDEGFNGMIGKQVKDLYASRREYVRAGNTPMSELCKLALNSLYGKTISKPSDTKIVVKSVGKASSYITNHWEEIIGMEKCPNNTIISVKNDRKSAHTNLTHVGGMILSMSRRIMNRVLALANDLKIVILYTDTDSMHLVDEDNGLERLVVEYRNLYKKELIGEDLGQFSLELKYPNHTGIHSERCIVLGKKVYLHEVHGKRENKEESKEDIPLPETCDKLSLRELKELNTDGVEKSKTIDSVIEAKDYYYHYRMKGVSKEAMREYPDILDTFERLYRHERLVFDLAYGDACNFDFSGDVKLRSEFTRNIQIEGEYGSLDEW